MAPRAPTPRYVATLPGGHRLKTGTIVDVAAAVHALNRQHPSIAPWIAPRVRNGIVARIHHDGHGWSIDPYRTDAYDKPADTTPDWCTQLDHILNTHSGA